MSINFLFSSENGTLYKSLSNKGCKKLKLSTTVDNFKLYISNVDKYLCILKRKQWQETCHSVLDPKWNNIFMKEKNILS